MPETIANAEKTHGIVLFDGVCNYCAFWVKLIIPRDSEGYFKFASLQSEVAAELGRKYNLELTSLNSIILIENGQIRTKSVAALEIARRMDGLWFLLGGLYVFPKFLRDWAYNLIANNRYAWFGKKESCFIPTPEIKSRFLE